MDIIFERNKQYFNQKKIDKLRKKELRNLKKKPTSIKVLKYAHEIEDFIKRKDENEERKRRTSQKALEILTDEKTISVPKKKSCFKKYNINIKNIENKNNLTESITEIYKGEQKDISINGKKEKENLKSNKSIDKNLTISRNNRLINDYNLKNNTTDKKDKVRRHSIINLSHILDKSKFINNQKKKISSIDFSKKFIHPKKKVEIIEPTEDNNKDNNTEQNLTEYKIKIYYEGKFLQITTPKEDNLNNFIIKLRKKLFNYNITDYELLYKLKSIYNSNEKDLSEKKLSTIFNDNDNPSLILRKKENESIKNKINTSVVISNFPSFTDLSNELTSFFQTETLESDFIIDFKENTCIVSFSLPEKAFSLASFLNKLKENNPIYKLLKIKLDYKLNVITDVAKNRKKLKQTIKIIMPPSKLRFKEGEKDGSDNSYAFSLRSTKTKKIFNYFKIKSKTKSKVVSLSPECEDKYKYFSKGGEDAPKVIVLDYKNKNKIKDDTKRNCSNIKTRRSNLVLSSNNLIEEYNIKKKSNIKEEDINENVKRYRNSIDSYNFYSTIRNNIKNMKDNENDEEDSFIAATKLNIKRKNSYTFENDLVPIKKERLQLQEIKKKKTNTDFHNILLKRKHSFIANMNVIRENNLFNYFYN